MFNFFVDSNWRKELKNDELEIINKIEWFYTGMKLPNIKARCWMKGYPCKCEDSILFNNKNYEKTLDLELTLGDRL